MSASALSLVSYSDTDDEVDDDDNNGQDILNHAETKYDLSSRCCLNSESLKADSKKKKVENGAEVEPTKIRSFPHERGTWASYVYVPVPHHDDLQELAGELLPILNRHSTSRFHASESLHISLSRTLKLRHHWLTDIHQSLSSVSHSHNSFYTSLRTVKFFTNDEKTRTFLSVEVASGWNKFLKLTDDVNRVISHYRLPLFYDKPSFHISICWCLHDARPSITDAVLAELQEAADSFFEENPECCLFKVQALQFKAGEKLYSIPLAAS